MAATIHLLSFQCNGIGLRDRRFKCILDIDERSRFLPLNYENGGRRIGSVRAAATAVESATRTHVSLVRIGTRGRYVLSVISFDLSSLHWDGTRDVGQILNLSRILLDLKAKMSQNETFYGGMLQLNTSAQTLHEKLLH
jgi:hypothetical protein